MHENSRINGIIHSAKEYYDDKISECKNGIIGLGVCAVFNTAGAIVNYFAGNSYAALSSASLAIIFALGVRHCIKQQKYYVDDFSEYKLKLLNNVPKY